jgi:hypothetical protein
MNRRTCESAGGAEVLLERSCLGNVVSPSEEDTRRGWTFLYSPYGKITSAPEGAMHRCLSNGRLPSRAEARELQMSRTSPAECLSVFNSLAAKRQWREHYAMHSRVALDVDVVRLLVDGVNWRAALDLLCNIK